MFPDKLLTPQFWTLDEKLKIYDSQYKKSLMHLKLDIITHLSTNSEISMLKQNNQVVDIELTKRFLGFIEKVIMFLNIISLSRFFKIWAFFKLKNKEKIDINSILDFQQLFIRFPFDLDSLSEPHLVSFIKVYPLFILVIVCCFCFKKDLSKFFNCQSIFTSVAKKRLEHYAFLMGKVNELLPSTLETVVIGDIYKVI
jgi:hypothetical protein